MKILNSATKIFGHIDRAILMIIFFLLTMSSAGFGLQSTQKGQSISQEQFVMNQKKGENRQLVSLEFDKEHLISALRRVAEQVQVGFSFQEYVIPDKKVTVNLMNVPVFEALDTLLKGTKLEAALAPDRDILIIREKLSQNLNIQLEAVSGTVTDTESGETLPGVNVIVKGTTTGTSTDSEGTYELNAPSLQDTLVFSFVGYQTQEVLINGRSEINVALQPQAITGEEMVVVGYGTQQKSDLTGSVGTVDAEEFQRSSPVNVQQGLAGKIAGVNVSQNSGRPGGGLR